MSSVPEFYNGKSILLTGCTGFLGKVLLEKLLYSCPGIDKIYVLVRKKKNFSTETRVRMLLDEDVFSRIRAGRPEVLSKVVAINGDLQQSGLGISDNILNTLKEQVAVVFHLAACVKFSQSLEEAVKTNVGGTEQMLELCRMMTNLKAFVYVSTAYSNSNKPVVEEMIYPLQCDLNDLQNRFKSGISNAELKEILDGRPNTYTFSKALAETFIAKNCKGIPTIIVRPSIVGASMTEPCKGWIDNWNGATGVLAATADGLNRVLLGDYEAIIDLIPVDYVANLIIVAAANHELQLESIEVFNAATSAINPVTFLKLGRIVCADSKANNKNVFIMPLALMTRCIHTADVITVLQSIPAYFADFASFLISGKTKYRNYIKKMLIMRKILEFFTTQQWIIHSTKTRNLYASLSETDKKEFPFDPKDIDWAEYIPTYCAGIRQYLYKSENR